MGGAGQSLGWLFCNVGPFWPQGPGQVSTHQQLSGSKSGQALLSCLRSSRVVPVCSALRVR